MECSACRWLPLDDGEPTGPAVRGSRTDTESRPLSLYDGCFCVAGGICISFNPPCDPLDGLLRDSGRTVFVRLFPPLAAQSMLQDSICWPSSCVSRLLRIHDTRYSWAFSSSVEVIQKFNRSSTFRLLIG